MQAQLCAARALYDRPHLFSMPVKPAHMLSAVIIICMQDQTTTEARCKRLAAQMLFLPEAE